jgi:hypothetical protein
MIFRAGTAEVRKMLDERVYLRPSFSTADEVLDSGWFIRGIPLKRIAEAILMRCGRKYLSWSNNQSHAPISSLQCAKTSLYGIARQNIPDEH